MLPSIDLLTPIVNVPLLMLFERCLDLTRGISRGAYWVVIVYGAPTFWGRFAPMGGPPADAQQGGPN